MPRSHTHVPDECTATTGDFAVRLLECQQRIAAFGTLYDEEVATLQAELTQLKTDFVRYYQAKREAQGVIVTRAPEAKTKRSGRGGKGSKKSSKSPES